MTDTKGDSRYYDSIYDGFAESLNAAIRAEAFGEEIGQNSWLTADEHRHFMALLEVDPTCAVLEVASGSGGPALFMAVETGCQVTGIDLHEDGVDAANAAAAERGLADRATFIVGDAREPLPFADASFDALECIDSMNHLADRPRVLGEFHRVLRPGGRVLFTNPITVTGILGREEMMIRSRGMGDFVFTAPGIDQSLLADAGFDDIRAQDVTANMARVAAAWGAARERHAAKLREIEGDEAFASLQEFLGVVALLASEHRLSRPVYVARRPTDRSATAIASRGRIAQLNQAGRTRAVGPRS